MDHARALGRLGAGAERPRPRLGVAGGEERAPAEQVVRGARDARHHALAEPEAFEQLGARLGVELRGLAPRAAGTPPARRRRRATARDERRRPRRAGRRRCSRPTSTGLSVSRNAGREQLALVGGEVGPVDRDAVAEDRRAPARARRSRRRATCRPWRRGCWRYEPPLDRREVGEHELELERVEVGRGVGVAGHRRVLERPQHVEDGVAVAERAEEPVAEPLAVLAPFTSAAMSTISKPVYTSFFECDISPRQVDPLVGDVRDARPRSRWSRTGARATTVSAPVSALNRLDLPLLGRPTRPRRSTVACRLPSPFAEARPHWSTSFATPMSKKTSKRKLKSRRNKANHGKKPNAGRK